MSDQGYEPTQVGRPVAGPATGPQTQVGYGGYGGPPTAGYGGPGGFPPPPDRRPWIIGGLVAAIVAVILAIVVVSAGGGDDDDVASDGTTTSSSAVSSTSSSSTSSSSTSSTSSSTTSSTSSTTATTAPPTTTTEAPPVTIAPATCSASGDNEANPDAAAQTVYDAWTRGDEDCARVLMTNAAFNRLFGNDGRGATFQLQGCGPTPDNPEIDSDCGFLTDGTAMHFWMIFSTDEGWLVTDVIQSED